MKFSALFLILFLSVVGYAQTGNYLLSHFSPEQKQSNNVCFDIVQDSRGVFYFATQTGVLQFDGRNWDIIRTNGAVYAIELAENGELFVAGSNGFGKITKNDNGLESFVPLYEKADAEYVFQILAFKESIYFLNEKNLFTYSIRTDSVTLISSNEVTGAFSGLNEIFGTITISTEENGIFNVKNGRWIKANLPLPDSTSLIFASKFENDYLLGTTDNRVFVYHENKRLSEVQLEDANYANASVILNATWVNQELVALGTLRGGIVFINPANGKTAEIINYSTGLLDNEIYTLVSDRNQNVWAAHTYGFTRVAPYLPLRSFSYYPGLQGNLLCATTFRGNVYVGTSLGLYKLEKEEFYDEITYYVNVLVKSRAKTQSKKPVSLPAEVKQEPEKGSFFKFLKRKKPEQTQSVAQAKQPTKPTRQKPRYKKEKRTKRILRSTFYGYKKVAGIDAKVTQLILWQNKLIAAGLDGAFEVNQLQSVPIIEDPVRFLFASEYKKMLIASTYDDKLHQLSIEQKDTWKDESKIQNIDDPINYIFEEGNKAVWFCSFDKIYRLAYSRDTVQRAHSMSIVNPSFGKTTGISLDDRVIIVTSAGFYFYDQDKKELQKSDSLAAPKDFFATGSSIWFRDEHQWFLTSKTGSRANLQLLNLFNDIRYLSTDARTNSVWIITGKNELFRFYSEKLKPIETTYPLFLKSIGQKDDVLVRKSSLEIDQENSSIKIEVVKPDYIGANAVEYRYFLQGLHTDWSDWSNNNFTIDFPYLPPGDYVLQFQSKDIFGKVSEMDPVTVLVLPPYWKRTWFYALEFAVFSCLVLLSFRLSSRFNVVSRLLSLLSIIILIEFIQTAAGSTFTTNSGPVVDFLIQVCVAFVILPVEGFLRKFMLASIERRKAISGK